MIDANLPPDLARWIESVGHTAIHVRDLNLERASDRVIWRTAREGGFCLVSKDEDFVVLSAIDRGGPSLVWIRIGNASRRALISTVQAHWEDLTQALQRGERVVEMQ